jgi:ABC-2 type transport system ATP-binding protein
VDGVARDVLAGIAGVTGVEERTTAAGRRQYALDADAETAPAVAAALHTAGFRLFALQPERRDLETVFAEVNAAGTPPATHAAAPTQARKTQLEVAHG